MARPKVQSGIVIIADGLRKSLSGGLGRLDGGNVESRMQTNRSYAAVV